MKKIRYQNKIFSSIIFFILCFSTILPNSLADSNSVNAKLQVEQTFTTTSNVALTEGQSTFSYVLESLDASNPMPEGVSQRTYPFFVIGTQTIYLPSMQYTREGNYEYRIYETTPEKENYTYDRRVYHVVIYVQMKNTGELGAEIVAYNEEGKKVAAILFHNAYDAPGASPSPSATISPPSPSTTIPPATTEPIPTGDKNTFLFYMATFFFAIILFGLIHVKRRLYKV